MIKKFIVIGIACLLYNNVQAQKISIDLNNDKIYEEKVSPKVRTQIEDFSAEIKKIVGEEKYKMDEEIKEVDKALANNDVDTKTADAMKKDISQSYANKINARIQELGFDLDNVIKKQVEYSILDSSDVISEKSIDELKKKYQPVNEMHGYVSWGVMSLADDDNQKLNNHLGFSSNLEFGLAYHRQFSRTSPFSLLSGVILSWRTLRFDDDYMIDRNENGQVDLVQYDRNLDKSKLRATYIMVPLGLKYSITGKLKSVGSDLQYRNINSGLSVGANIYGGVKISNNNIVKGDGISSREKGTNYNVNPFVYGAQFTLSLNSVNLFVRQDLSPYFKDNTFDERKMLQFGINFGF